MKNTFWLLLIVAFSLVNASEAGEVTEDGSWLLGTSWRGKMEHVEQGVEMFLHMDFANDKSKPLQADFKIFYMPNQTPGTSTNLTAKDFEIDIEKRTVTFMTTGGLVFKLTGVFDEGFKNIQGDYYVGDTPNGIFSLTQQ